MATFPTTKNSELELINNPRHGRIILWTSTEMEEHLGQEIEPEKVYEMKDEPEYVIKKFKVSTEQYWKIFDNEVHAGRIAHPFINPIIARAESDSRSTSIAYFMYPNMGNGNLRQNIEREKKGECLSPDESNCTIWTRCIYQIFQVMNYLHRLAEPFGGPVFLRCLTSCSIFLDENFNVKIGDFGIAMESELNTKVQSGYHPPIQNIEYTASDDIFVVGVVILEILTGDNAKLNGDPKFLYQKYNFEGGLKYLIDDLEKRSGENRKWRNELHRNKLAEIALKAICHNGMMDEFLKELRAMCQLESERYRRPKNSNRCVSCHVNPRAQLSLKGQNCVKDKCMPFCVYCLINHHFSPLMCPEHGETRPPLSDHVFGVLVAGNNVKKVTMASSGKSQPYTVEGVAENFVREVETVFKILTSKHPFVLGACKDNLELVKPNKPGTKEDMEPRIIKAFDNINSVIKKTLEKYSLDPEKHRLPNSLFIFYFSGHCSKDGGLQLGNEKDTLEASKKWIKEMLHKKLRVDQVLVILDCCNADSQNFANTEGLYDETESVPNTDAVESENATIVQFSSCKMNEGSLSGSVGLFTSLLFKGWKSLNSSISNNGKLKICKPCKEQKLSGACEQFHIQCKDKQIVTLFGLGQYLQSHLCQASSGTMNSTVNSPSGRNIYLAYYDTFKSHILIHLKCSKEKPELFWFSSQYKLEQDLKKAIFEYAVKNNVCRDLLTLKNARVQNASNLIAIHSKFGKEKMNELTSLNDIHQAWSTGHDLEARVRIGANRLCHGPVKLGKIRKVTVEEKDQMKYLIISESSVQIAIKSISDAKNEMEEKKRSACNMKLKNLIKEVLLNIQSIESLLEGKQDMSLKFYLYNDFSVLAIE